MDISIDLTHIKKFVYRVAAIIEHNDSVLVQEFDGTDFLSLPGGRVKHGEDSKKALIRELKEELNAEVDEVSQTFFVENFFKYDGKSFHEVGVIYRVKLQDVHLPALQNLRSEGSRFFWMKKNELEKSSLKPEFLKNAIRSSDPSFKQVINIDH